MNAPPIDIQTWLLGQLRKLTSHSHLLVIDSLRLLPERDPELHDFATQHNYTMITASTNLVFRELYGQATEGVAQPRVLVVDRTPASRRAGHSQTKAPPPFYPDLLEHTPAVARIDLDLRQFLIEATGDRSWPKEVNEPRYAPLIRRHLDGVLAAHRNLRAAAGSRFTDQDLQTIVAFAALGVPESAFRVLDADQYWRIGLQGHEALRDLDSLAPDVARSVKDVLRKAPAPFCSFVDHDSEDVIRAFYLAVIFAQHTELWHTLLAAIEPGLAPLAKIEQRILAQAAPRLVALDREQAHHDLQELEDRLDGAALGALLCEHGKLTALSGFAAIIERERYSTLLRELALLVALGNALSAQANKEEHTRLRALLFPAKPGTKAGAVTETPADQRVAARWTVLREAYRLAGEIQALRAALAVFMKAARPRRPADIPFAEFRKLWNEKRVNRLEYYLSRLRRLVETSDLLPRPASELPTLFGSTEQFIRTALIRAVDETDRDLRELNDYFQRMVVVHYPAWVQGTEDVHLTSQFIGTCLARHWDPQNEKAVIFVFDGMRYDIWDEMVRPLFEGTMELQADLPALSILPSATRYSRWAIAAGAEPADFWPPAAENAHLQKALAHHLHLTGEVKVLPVTTTGTGEVVRYQAGNLTYYIFEVCDKALHHIDKKVMADGRIEPSRPLAYIYEQQVKSIIDNEVMAIVRKLEPGTKVFVVADHGFGPIGDERIGIGDQAVNQARDCAYQYARLRVPASELHLPKDKRDNLLAFTPQQLGAPASEAFRDQKNGQTWTDNYAQYVFPRTLTATAYALSRPGSPFKPDYFSHGGISLQEMIIPMIVLQVKQPQQGILSIGQIAGPREVVEGQELAVVARLIARLKGGMFDELQVDLEAAYSVTGQAPPLPRRVLYVGVQGTELRYAFTPDAADATNEERKAGRMDRVLTITASCKDGRRTVRVAQAHRFAVVLNTDRVVRRVPAGLGSILGMMPKNVR